MKTFKTIVSVVFLIAINFGSAQSQTVEDRKAVLDAQIDLVKKQKELQDVLRTLAGTSLSGMPVVVSVTVGSERIARLQLQNGIVGHYREGEVVRPGVIVSSISPKQVFVAIAKGKKTVVVPLEFAGPVIAGISGASAQQAVPDILLPSAPSVIVPAIEIPKDMKFGK